MSLPLPTAIADLRAAFAAAGIDRFSIHLERASDIELMHHALRDTDPMVEVIVGARRYNASIGGVPLTYPVEIDDDPAL